MRWLLVAVLVLVVAGCGGDDKTADDRTGERCSLSGPASVSSSWPTPDRLSSTAVGWGPDGRVRVRTLSGGWAIKARRIVRAGIYRVNPANMAFVLERRVPMKGVC